MLFVSAYLLFSVSCVSWVSGQAGGDQNDLISQIYQSPGSSTTKPAPVDLTPNKNGDSGTSAATNGNCACVPYYLCRNNTIITDGSGLIDIRMKEGPCGNYFEICCGKEDTLDKAIKPDPVERQPGCGWRNPEGVGFRITHAVDGEANFAEFPWMVAVLREDPVEGSASKQIIYKCGGSLIHPKVVLTAAHCVTGRNLGKKYKIRAGEWDAQTRNEVYQHQDRDVETIITHDHYSSGTLYNDIALLVLKDPVEITENVDIVCLPPLKEVSTSNQCFASGWGTNVFGKEEKHQAILKKVDLPMVSHPRCQELLRKTRLGQHFELHSSFVCAGGVGGKDTCKGDGGSPLVCPIPGQKERYYQTGIVAWGIGCGESNNPGVYTNVAGLRDWIDEQMQYQRLDLNSYKY